MLNYVEGKKSAVYDTTSGTIILVRLYESFTHLE